MPHKKKGIKESLCSAQDSWPPPIKSLVQSPASVRHQYLSGLPKDPWELSQMLGRGGRDGKQAAFVILLWAGQAGW